MTKSQPMFFKDKQNNLHNLYDIRTTLYDQHTYNEPTFIVITNTGLHIPVTNETMQNITKLAI